MDRVMSIAARHNLLVIEDAAQAIDSMYKGVPLGSIGHLGAFSFHETKNIVSGEGGMLTINDARFVNRAEIIREKGTNRSAFFRGEVDKYTWVDIGSSFLPSEIISAFLYAQLENLDRIQRQRIHIWELYDKSLAQLRKVGGLIMPEIPTYATNNAHMYYLVCRNLSERMSLINTLRNDGVQAVSHYISLHDSPFYRGHYAGANFPNADRYTDGLVRLPLFFELRDEQVLSIASKICTFYGV
jgi:dTDP-4-amino-4,6-dideoxygalactose transaminase